MQDLIEVPVHPSVYPWQVESLRFTAFPTSAYKDAGDSMITPMTGEPPSKRVVDNLQGVVAEEVGYKGGKLTVTRQLGRIDVVLGCDLGAPTKEGTTFRTLGGFQQLLPVFTGLIVKWLETGPALQRIAFGCVLIAPVESRRTGYKELGSFLPKVQLDIENSADFYYQINRPRLVNIDGLSLKINRVSRWSVAGNFLVQMIWGPVSRVFSPTKSVGAACRLELDINSDAEHEGELPREKLNGIVVRVLGLATEISEKGDIP